MEIQQSDFDRIHDTTIGQLEKMPPYYMYVLTGDFCEPLVRALVDDGEQPCDKFARIMLVWRAYEEFHGKKAVPRFFDTIRLDIYLGRPISTAAEPGISTSEEEITPPPLILRLAPFFFGERDAAREFVQGIRTLTPRQVVQRARQFSAQGRLSPLSIRRPLWKTLSEAGIYPLSEANWNKQMR